MPGLLSKKTGFVVILTFLSAISIAVTSFAEEAPESISLIEQGEYIAAISGCHDCHTPGYAVNEGNVSRDLWFTGDTFGWSGPWGTTYGTNLRLFVANMNEKQWVETAQNLRRRPPMPWFNLNKMKEADLVALYHFILSLGEPGIAAPAALSPDQAPKTAHALWVIPD